MNLQDINQTTAAVGERAHKLWLAGLGAVARARQNGEKLFAELVAEGADVQRSARKEIDATVTRLRKRTDSRVKEARKVTTGRFKRLERAFDDRTEKVLKRLDIPTRESIDKLARQVEKLAKEVKALEASKAK